MNYREARILNTLTLTAALMAAVLGLGNGCSGTKPQADGLKLTRTFPLPGATHTRTNVGVPGRIDHLAYDPVTQRLFVAALENGSMEVIDLSAGERVKSVPGIEHAQGAACVTNASLVAITSGEDGGLHLYDTATLVPKRTVDIGSDADNVRFDARNNTVLVTYGTTNAGAIAVLDARTWQRVRDIVFPSRPESFQLDPEGKWLFANLPKGVRAVADGEVAIADRESGEVVATIPLPGLARNFPMAYDSAHRRLFIACRRPARVLVIDVPSRRIISQAPCTDDSDDLFYDAQSGQVLVVGGGFRPDLQTPELRSPCSPPGEMGAIDVFAVDAAGMLTRKPTVPTYYHARTGLFVPARHALYVAVPLHGERQPEIREYTLE
jgi:DNA-binding beta-propeller fold protein YncE